MRISDWSSDVCSSDLAGAGIDQVKAHPVERGLRDIQRLQPFGDIMRPAKEAQRLIVQRLKAQRSAVHPGGRNGAEVGRLAALWRSEARRVGKECVLQCKTAVPPSV